MIKNKKLSLIFVVGLAAGATWFAFFRQSGPQIMPFEYDRDHQAIRDIFKRDWDWLIPAGVTEKDYSLDLPLKHRAPQQNPFLAGRMHINVLRDGDAFIGFLAYYLKSSNVAFLNFVDINPEFRGKGFAKKLIQHALEQMKARGIKKVEMVTYPFNDRALNLYRQIGFQEVGRDVQVELEYNF